MGATRDQAGGANSSHSDKGNPDLLAQLWTQWILWAEAEWLWRSHLAPDGWGPLHPATPTCRVYQDGTCDNRGRCRGQPSLLRGDLTPHTGFWREVLAGSGEGMPGRPTCSPWPCLGPALQCEAPPTVDRALGPKAY